MDCCTVPLTTTRFAADAAIGRFVLFTVRLASDEISWISDGESVTTFVSDITSGNAGSP